MQSHGLRRYGFLMNGGFRLKKTRHGCCCHHGSMNLHGPTNCRDRYCCCDRKTMTNGFRRGHRHARRVRP